MLIASDRVGIGMVSSPWRIQLGKDRHSQNKQNVTKYATRIPFRKRCSRSKDTIYKMEFMNGSRFCFGRVVFESGSEPRVNTLCRLGHPCEGSLLGKL